MTSHERIFTKSQAMGYGVLCALPFLIVTGCLYRFILSDHADQMMLGGLSFYVSFIIIIVISVTLHELLHGLGWMLAGHLRWADIYFHVSAMMPTTNCKIPLTKRAYLTGVLLPFIVFGLTGLAALLLLPGTLTLLIALTNFTLAGADLLIALCVIREPANACFTDHPTMAGYLISK